MQSQAKNIKSQEEDQSVTSPFADTTSIIRPSVDRSKAAWPFWILSVLLVLVIIGNLVYFSLKYLGDPYRMLEPFPVDRYFSDYLPLSGSKFKAEVKVVADLGWKGSTGRLMVFTVGNDTRPLGVLIPPKFSGTVFTKGQTYQISLEVNEGGLLYADSCDKE